jgi:hypothetical protein
VSKNDGFYAGAGEIKYRPIKDEAEILRDFIEFVSDNNEFGNAYAIFKSGRWPLVIDKHDFLSIYPEQIIAKSYTILDISYLKKRTNTQMYYDPGEIVYDSWGFARTINSGWKERTVNEPDWSPNEIYQSCLEYYIKELRLDKAKETDLWSFELENLLNDGLGYYGIHIVVGSGNTGKGTYGNEYFSVNIYTDTTRFEASYNKNNIVGAMVRYSILFTLLPTLLLCFVCWKKYPQKRNLILIAWILINYAFLVLSSFSGTLNDKSIHSSESFKTVWPFNSNIIRKNNKQIFIEKDEYYGGSKIKQSDEKIK